MDDVYHQRLGIKDGNILGSPCFNKTSLMEGPYALSYPFPSSFFPLLTIAVFKHCHKSQGTPNKPDFLFLPRVSTCKWKS